MGIYAVGGIHEQELWRYHRIPSVRGVAPGPEASDPDTCHLNFPPAVRLRRLPVDRMSNEIMVIRLTFAAPPNRARSEDASVARNFIF